MPGVHAAYLAGIEVPLVPALTLAEQADLISVSRSSLNYVPRAPSEWEVRVKHRRNGELERS